LDERILIAAKAIGILLSLNLVKGSIITPKGKNLPETKDNGLFTIFFITGSITCCKILKP